jgi:hypothetical protein
MQDELTISPKKSKAQAGALGGKATYDKYGRDHMADIGRAGAEVTHTRYHLAPAGTSGWAMVDRVTGQVKAIIGNGPLDHLLTNRPAIDDCGF